jgi:hypothetical protein
MYTALAVGVGISYFALGWSANTVSFVCAIDLLISRIPTDLISTLPPPTGKNTSRMSSQNQSRTMTKKITL